MASISGKLEPLHFTITPKGDKQIVEVYALKAGLHYHREFDANESVKDMLRIVKLDLFSV